MLLESAPVADKTQAASNLVVLRTVPTRLSLDRQYFDVIVIGGGINGVAIARECAQAGQRTLLVERHDFGSGTTSRATRIIHGGLRYLEHGEVSLVRESIRERGRMLAQRPHLVRPKTFLLALPPGKRSVMEIRLGLWLYRRFAHQRTPQEIGEQIGELEAKLDQGTSWSLFSYEDAQCEFPEILVAEWLSEGLAAGLVARNHTDVLDITIAHGKVRGALFRDLTVNEDFAITADHVINAAGPWVDQVCARGRFKTSSPLIGGVRGSHLVLPPLAGLPATAVYSEALDGRPFFVIPWNRQVLVGTTEVSDTSDPSAVAATSEECAYLLNSLCRMFPKAAVTAADIHYTYAGVRPLPFEPDATPSAVTRRHFLHDHADDGVFGLISVIGGKLTTAASLARECARKIGIDVAEPSEAEIISAHEVSSQLARCVSLISELGSLSQHTAQAIAEWHGRGSRAIAQLASTNQRLRQPICEHTNHILAEAICAHRDTMASTLGDILLRRVPVGLDPSWSKVCTIQASERIGQAVGWNSREIGLQAEEFEAERARFLQKPLSGLAAVAQRIPPRSEGLGEQRRVVTD